MVENLVSGHDIPTLNMRDNAEDVWKGEVGQRLRRTIASKEGFGGYSIFSDNVGKVVFFFIFEF